MPFSIPISTLLPLLKIRKQEGKPHIFSETRKKYLVLAPEELVRQLFIKFLVQHGIPQGLIREEMKLMVHEQMRRCDILIFDPKGKPILLVECKSAKVNINQDTLDQIARYNIPLAVPYLIVTNGHKNHLFKIDHENKSFSEVDTLPSWEEIIG